MDGETASRVGIVRLYTQRVARVEQRVRHLVGLQESILHEDITADMMCVAAPINVDRGAHTVFRHIVGQRKSV